MKAVRKLSVTEGRLLGNERLGCSRERIGEAAGDIWSWKSVMSLKTHCDYFTMKIRTRGRGHSGNSSLLQRHQPQESISVGNSSTVSKLWPVLVLDIWKIAGVFSHLINVNCNHFGVYIMCKISVWHRMIIFLRVFSLPQFLIWQRGRMQAGVLLLWYRHNGLFEL